MGQTYALRVYYLEVRPGRQALLHVALYQYYNTLKIIKLLLIDTFQPMPPLNLEELRSIVTDEDWICIGA